MTQDYVNKKLTCCECLNTITVEIGMTQPGLKVVRFRCPHCLKQLQVEVTLVIGVVHLAPRQDGKPAPA